MQIDVANGDVAGLVRAIAALNAGGGGAITLAANGVYEAVQPDNWWYGPNAFPAISSEVTINGNGATIRRAADAPKFRFFYVSGGFSTLPAGRLSLKSLTLANGLARGGNGGAGGGTGGKCGGGGAGLGGAVFNQGTLVFQMVALTQNVAAGGVGHQYAPGRCAGGGGGLGGNGGAGDASCDDEAGGGGFRTDGKQGRAYLMPRSSAGGGCFMGSEGGEPVAYGTQVTGGTSDFGGKGAPATFTPEANNPAGGGGGFRAGDDAIGRQPGCGGGTTYGETYGGVAFGSGGAFGGGGEGSDLGGGGGVGGGGGGGAYYGGGGGFGGGGGGGGDGGPGGFGGGGGEGVRYADHKMGSGGFGGAAGGDGGGGGAGLGSALFNHIGSATLTSCTISGNVAKGGEQSADAMGCGAIFNLNGSVVVTTSRFSGNVAQNGAGESQPGADFYNLSLNAGRVSYAPTPLAKAVFADGGSYPSGLVNNAIDGNATINAEPVQSVKTNRFGDTWGLVNGVPHVQVGRDWLRAGPAGTTFTNLLVFSRRAAGDNLLVTVTSGGLGYQRAGITAACPQGAGWATLPLDRWGNQILDNGQVALLSAADLQTLANPGYVQVLE